MFRILSRDQLRTYIKQELGDPVINVEVAIEQLDNAIDKAIHYFIERHDDGIEEIFIEHPIDDITRSDGFIELDDQFVGIHSIMNSSSSGQSGDSLDNLNHLVAKSDIFSGQSLNMSSMINYVSNYKAIANIKYFLDPFYDFEFNKITNRLHFKNDLSKINKLGIIAYRKIDPDLDFDIFNDEWIKRYATALAHRQWGVNLSKYTNMDMPGQGQINGEGILSEGKELVASALEEFEETYGIPPFPRVE